MEHLKFPVGKFSFPQDFNFSDLQDWINVLKNFPDQLENLINMITQDQLLSTYRPGGWTAKQVIHHISDSHTHALMRFKWSLTEEKPVIKPYLEDKFAGLSDYELPVNTALTMIKAVHLKWSSIIENMAEADWHKGYFHPQSNRFFTLYDAMALYAWHCRHHFAHIKICMGLPVG